MINYVQARDDVKIDNLDQALEREFFRLIAAEKEEIHRWYMEQLYQEFGTVWRFKGKNIYFVSISIDASKAPWIKMVQEEKLGGIQLHGGSKAQIVKDYSIRAIPRFILLDKDGKIINSDMSRPSDADTESTLNGLEGI